jgi:hypothetical protein
MAAGAGAGLHFAGAPHIPMALPLKILCECGHTSYVEAGNEAVCVCGRRYDTSGIPAERLVSVRITQAKARLYMRLGFVFVVVATLAGYLVYGLRGAALTLPTAALVLFRVVQPRFQARQRAALDEVEPWQVEARK